MYMKYMKENMRLCIDISYMYQAINLKVVELIVRLPQVKGYKCYLCQQRFEFLRELTLFYPL